MTKVVYGVFEDGDSAQQTLDKLNENHRTNPFNVFVHSGHVREEDVQLGGTGALAGMIIGGLVVGLIGGLLAALVIFPGKGMTFGWEVMFMTMLGGSVFGVVAGAVAGASECKPSIRDSARFVDRGKIMMTAEVDDGEVAEVVEAFTDGGGRDVRAA